MSVTRPHLLLLAVFLAAIGIAAYWYSADQEMHSPPSVPAAPQSNAELLKTAGVETVSQEADYFERAKGYFARPKADGAYPGVVMIHEWWGLNDQIKRMADQLAGQGYDVLAVDLYGGSVATTSDQAMKLVGALDQAKALQNLKTAAAYLRAHQALKIASLGWCFGGGQSLQLALSGEKLDAAVVYYGSPLVLDENRLKAIGGPLLGVFGEKDMAVPIKDSKTFAATLDKLGIENEMYFYPGVGHAFANPSGPNYAPKETLDAWSKTLAFLQKHLKQ